jgi:ankyrin repeat protein
MGNEQKLLMRNGMEKTGVPVERKNRFFMRACAPILVAAMAVGGSIGAGCSKEKDDYGAVLSAAQAALREEANQSLVRVAKNGNLRKVKQALEDGADPNLGESQNISILIGVCELGKTKIAEELINHGAHVNYSNGYDTALISAVEKKHFETARMLVNRGANVNVVVPAGSVLRIAAENGDLRTVKLLVENGAGLEARYEGRATPFLAAAEAGKLEVVKYLFARGADAKAEMNGQSAISLAISNGNYKTAEFLINNREYIYGIEELKAAARKGKIGLAKRIVEKGADFTVFRDVETPLMAAAEAGKVEMVRYLLETPLFFNALDAEDEKGDTALIKAAGAGKLDVVRLLIKAEADLNAKDDSGKTALAHAESNGNKATYNLLLSSGAKY